MCSSDLGDIPWTGANARPGTLLGLTQPFLSVWADLAVLAHCPALFVTCTHAPTGRFTLDFSPLRSLAPGDEPAAIAAYFSHLNAAISQHPADAVAHLTWPCFGPERTSRRRAQARSGSKSADPHSGGQRSPGRDPQPSLSRKVR